MVRRQVSVWVDEEILRLFDEWAWGLRLSRTRAVEQVMGAAVRGTFQLEMPVEGAMLLMEDGTFAPEGRSEPGPKVAAEKEPEVIAKLKEAVAPKPPETVDEIVFVKSKPQGELAGRLEEVRAACTHPKDKVEKFSWGKRCGECGQVLK